LKTCLGSFERWRCGARWELFQRVARGPRARTAADRPVGTEAAEPAPAAATRAAARQVPVAAEPTSVAPLAIRDLCAARNRSMGRQTDRTRTGFASRPPRRSAPRNPSSAVRVLTTDCPRNSGCSRPNAPWRGRHGHSSWGLVGRPFEREAISFTVHGGLRLVGDTSNEHTGRYGVSG
jgi:hypothetical protein